MNRFRNRWLVLLVLFLACTAMGFQFPLIASVPPLLVSALALDLAMLGALVGAWMLPGVDGRFCDITEADKVPRLFGSASQSRQFETVPTPAVAGVA